MIANEVRVAARMLTRRPLLTLTIVVELAIGLGAALAAFAIADTILLRMPPLPHPERIVVAWEIDPKQPEHHGLVSPADFFDWQNSHAFSSVAAWMPWNANLINIDVPQRVHVALVSGSFFEVLGGAPLAGRALRPDDARRGAADVVVISERLWRSSFHGDPNLVGRTIHLGGDTATVAGIMPRSLAVPSADVDVWSPLIFGVHFQPDDRGGRNLRVIGRLRDGVTIEQASSVLAGTTRRIASIAPQSHAGFSASAATIHDEETRDIRPTIVALFAAAVAMLGVAIANVVNLLLMLAASRRREIATLRALGARRGSLLRRAAIEGTLLGLASALGALALAATALALLGAAGGFLLVETPIGISPAVAAIAVAIATGVTVGAMTMTTLFFGNAPLLVQVRGSKHPSAGAGIRNGLAIAQIALTMMLLLPSALLVESFCRLASVHPGFDVDRILTAGVWLPQRYDTIESQNAFFSAAIEKLRAIPGVADAATIQDLPLRGNAMNFDVAVDDGERQRATKAAYRLVSDRYFSVMGIPVLRGRAFAASDTSTSGPVLIINGALAQKAFGSADPLGHRVRIGTGGRWATIVGIAGDVKQMGLDGGEVPALYQPLSQKQFAFLRWSSFVVRTEVTPSPRLTGAVRKAIASIDPQQPLYDIRTVNEIIREQIARPRLAASVVSYLAALAMIVALLGVAGVLAYAVTLRSHEFAVRVALGARPADLLHLVLRNAAALATAGILAGTFLTSAAIPLLERLLFRGTATDPRWYVITATALLIATLAAGTLPALRAARIDPATALRYE